MRTSGGAREEEKWFPECEGGSESDRAELQFEFRDLNLYVFGWSPTGPLCVVTSPLSEVQAQNKDGRLKAF